MTNRQTDSSCSMLSTGKDGNCVNDDCIPFNQVTASGNPDGADVGLGECLDKGNNGRTPRVWITPHSRRSQKHVTRALYVLVFILLILLIIFICLWIRQRNAQDGEMCFEPSCIRAAADILSNLDTSVSPCDEFYKYACNGWIRKNHIPTGQNTWSILRKLTKDGEYYTKDVLENSSKADDPPSRGLQLARIFYNSCLDENTINARGFTPLFESLVSFYGGWILLPDDSPGARKDGGSELRTKAFNVTQLYLPSFRLFGSSPLCKISVGNDQRNSSRFVIDLTEGSVGLQKEHYVNETIFPHKKPITAYRKFMRNYTRMLGVPEANLSAMDDVYQFEKQIAQRTEERGDRDPERNYELVTVKELYTYCPVFDWKWLLNELYRPLNFTIEDDQFVAINDRDFFRARCKLYEEYLKNDTGIRTLHNSAIWYFLWRTVARMPVIVNRALEEYKEVDLGYKVDGSRWQTCVADVTDQFTMVIGRLFVRDRFDEASKKDAIEMIDEIKMAFKENFDSVDWMKEEDKLKAIEKVDNMGASIGYPPDIFDVAEENRTFVHITELNEKTYFENGLRCTESNMLNALRLLIIKDRHRWDLSPHVVNAFYKENANHIYFPAGILQSPVYNRDHPAALNFGGIGMVMGHEITHAFDHYGSKRDSQGNLRQWWSEQTREAFERNSQCMIDQYSSYTILDTKLNGKLTLGENIADNGGMKAAFKAFKKVEERSPSNMRLPGVNFTSEQLFFLSFAQIWCVTELPQAVLNTVLFDVHTVDPYRVIGTLSNSEEFARVFNCPKDSPMNPSKKCAVW